MSDVLEEVRQVLEDADRVIAYYLDMEKAMTIRTGTAASIDMRRLGESVLIRLRGA